MTQRLVRSLLPHFAVSRRPVAGAVYGTVSVVAVIVVASHQSATAGGILLLAAVSMVVIWAVHVYASTLAATGASGLDWPTAMARALHEEFGVLQGAAAPLAVLVAGAVGILDDELSVWLAVWCGVVLLSLIPLVWLRRRGSTWGSAVVASMVSGLFGLLLLALKVVLH